MSLSALHIEENRAQELPQAMPKELGQSPETSFGERFLQAMTQLAAPIQEGQGAVDAFSRGQEGELHSMLLKVDKADISLKYMVTLRNKALEAYREIMRMGS